MGVEAGVELKTVFRISADVLKKKIPLGDSIWLKSTRSSKRPPYNHLRTTDHWGTRA